MSQEFINIIETCVITPLLTALTGVLIAFITKQAKRYKSELESKQLDQYISISEKIVEQAVVSVTQTYVEPLKKEGLFGTEAQKEAFEKSKTLVHSLMKLDYIKAIKECYSDFDKWLETKIEELVNNAK